MVAATAGAPDFHGIWDAKLNLFYCYCFDRACLRRVLQKWRQV